MKSYISAEEFLSLDKEIQKVFIDWWNPKHLDKVNFNNFECPLFINDKIFIITYDEAGDCLSPEVVEKCDLIPLLQMHQLIAFIEEKTNCRLNITYCSEGYYIEKVISDEFYENIIDEFLGDNLLDALFKIAVEISKQITQD